MPKIILTSGTYKLFQIEEDDSFEQWLRKFYGDGSTKEAVEETLKNKEIKQTPTIPKYLSHCSYIKHIQWMIDDRRLGGREVTSGQVVLTPNIIHLSVIPLLTGHYNRCIVFKTENLIRKNPNNKLTPTLYNYNEEDIKIYFDNDGWQKRQLLKSDKKDFAIKGYRHEREWNMEAIINFELEDIEAILTKRNYDNYETLNDNLLNLKRLKELDDFSDFFKQYNRLKNRLYYFIRDTVETLPNKYNPIIYKLEQMIEDETEKTIILQLMGASGFGDLNIALTEKEIKGKIYEDAINFGDYKLIKKFFKQGLILTKDKLVYWGFEKE
jgi:hypothetical protein